MKTWLYRGAFVILLSVFSALARPALALDIAEIYPVRPGMAEWADFHSTQEMIDACRIPQELLETMSEADLVAAALNYPLIANLTAYDPDYAGLYADHLEINDALAELERRGNATQALFAQLLSDEPVMQSLVFEDEPESQRRFEQSILIILLRCPEQRQNLSESQLQQLEQIAANLYPRNKRGSAAEAPPLHLEKERLDVTAYSDTAQLAEWLAPGLLARFYF